MNDPIDTPLSVTGSGDRPIIDWIFSSEEYIELYHQYFAEFLNSTDFVAIIDTTVGLISPYVEKDPTAFYSYEEFELGIAALQEFCLLRAESIQGQVDGIIPSTNEGQTADTMTLIDASTLNLSDMGSMNMDGMGRNRDGGREEADAENFFGGRGGNFGNSRGNGAGSKTQNSDAEAPSDNGSTDFGTGENKMQELPQMGGMTPGEQDTDPALSENNDTMQQFPRGMQMPGSFGGNGAPSQPGESTTILLIISVMFLFAGLIAAFKFKR